MTSAFSLFDFVGRVNCRLQVTQIVQAVEDTDNINTVRDRLLNKAVYNVICIRSVSQDILTSEKHLQLSYS